MTPTDDLATLRDYIKSADWETQDVPLAALSRLETELARLERERDEGLNYWRTHGNDKARAEAAEAEVTRLQEGLRLIPVKWQKVARSLLADTEATA